MIRNSIMYRRLWYIRRRNANKLNILSRIIIVVSIFILFAVYVNRQLFPHLIEISENKVELIVSSVVRETVEGIFTSEEKFDDLIIKNKDDKGNIISIDTNVAKLNRLSLQASSEIHNQLVNMQSEKVSIPFGMLLGNTIFSSLGPKLFINIQPYGSVETEFKSEYTILGNKQAKFTLYLQVKTKAGIEAPFLRKKSDIITNIPVIETIIIKEQ
ncbi:MAG TPA: sporulation protein YunB [Clostridiaceae bacterium]|nr:sporulation protein YunB [Clostridiaceae bacterium]